MYKCPACKYEKRTQQVETEKVIRYKSGKNKGEIKEVQNEVIDVYPKDPEFIDIEFKKDVDHLVMHSNEYGRGLWCGRFIDDREEADLKCCPKCGNLFVGKINETWYDSDS